MTENGKPLTIKHVAMEAGVSTATVSRALNNKKSVSPDASRKIFEAINKIGYIPQRTLSKDSKSKKILVILPRIGNPFYNLVFDGIIEASRRYNYSVLIYQPNDSFSNFDKCMRAIDPIDPVGIIFLGDTFKFQNINVLEKISAKYPVVTCGWYFENLNLSYVSVNNKLEFKKLTEFLISKGRKNIAFVSHNTDYPTALERRSGYVEALSIHNHPINEQMILEFTSEKILESDQIFSAATQLFGSSIKPDAIVCGYDYAAAATLKAAKKMGISVPKDCAIIGFDNLEISFLVDPPLTTVNVPRFQLGYLGFEQLIERINNPKLKPRKVYLDCDLIIREST